MGYWVWILVGLLLIWLIWFKIGGRLNASQAKEFVDAGALVVDVRTEKEFSENSLPGVINIPLGEVREKIGKLERDKDRVILCYCLSGGRSGIAASRLRKLGYKHAYNLGSYGQAEAVLVD